MENPSLESQIIDALGAYSFIFTNSPLEQSKYIKLAEKYDVETAVEEPVSYTHLTLPTNREV